MRAYCNGLAVLAVVGACCLAAEAQWRVIAGEADPDGCFPKTPARICLGSDGTTHCYAPASAKDYIFGLEPKAERIGELDGQPLVLFSAMFSGCGSGTLTDYSLLTVRGGEWVNLLPAVRLTNQSELKTWNLPKVSRFPVIVTADFIWDYERFKQTNGQEETHFARHRYEIAAFVYNTKKKEYVQRIDSSTTKKYPGLNDMDEVQVLRWEGTRILAGLHKSP